MVLRRVGLNSFTDQTRKSVCNSRIAKGPSRWLFCLDDGSLDIGLQAQGADAFEHQIEGRRPTDFMPPDLDRNLLEYPKHGAARPSELSRLPSKALCCDIDSRMADWNSANCVRDERRSCGRSDPRSLIVPVGWRSRRQSRTGTQPLLHSSIDVREQTNAFFGFHSADALDNPAATSALVSSMRLANRAAPLLRRRCSQYCPSRRHTLPMSSRAVTITCPMRGRGIWWPCSRRW